MWAALCHTLTLPHTAHMVYVVLPHLHPVFTPVCSLEHGFTPNLPPYYPSGATFTFCLPPFCEGVVSTDSTSAPRHTACRETRQNLRTNDNSLQIQQWPLGRVPLINGGGERQTNSNPNGVPTVPSRRYSIQCITDWIGEQDNPQTTVTCSPQSRIPSQYLETSQATPFHSL